jgi:hypothetical protein
MAVPGYAPFRHPLVRLYILYVNVYVIAFPINL